MLVADVEQAVRHARKVVENHSDDGLLHEAATRYYLIDPILQALGWNLEDPDYCQFEVPLTLNGQQKKADYILLNRNQNQKRNHAVLIEAKGFVSTKLNGWSEEYQLKDYASQSSAKIAVLTNGQVWYIYENSRFGEPRGPDVDICNKDVQTAAEELDQRLSRHNVLKLN